MKFQHESQRVLIKFQGTHLALAERGILVGHRIYLGFYCISHWFFCSHWFSCEFCFIISSICFVILPWWFWGWCFVNLQVFWKDFGFPCSVLCHVPALRCSRLPLPLVVSLDYYHLCLVVFPGCVTYPRIQNFLLSFWLGLHTSYIDEHVSCLLPPLFVFSDIYLFISCVSPFLLMKVWLFATSLYAILGRHYQHLFSIKSDEFGSRRHKSQTLKNPISNPSLDTQSGAWKDDYKSFKWVIYLFTV